MPKIDERYPEKIRVDRGASLGNLAASEQAPIVRSELPVAKSPGDATMPQQRVMLPGEDRLDHDFDHLA